MNSGIKIYAVVLIHLIILSCRNSLIFAQSTDCAAQNVIVIIGDGMGLAHLSYLAYSIDEPLVAESFPVVGFQKTHSASHIITDSGAAATAISCGTKTYNSAIGISSDSLPCVSLFELAKEQGKLTGIVVTSSLVHATPAAFVAHQRLRGFHEEIAESFVSQRVDYFVGGGQMYFSNRYSDDRDLVKELRELQYTVSGYDRKSFHAFAGRVDRRMAYFTAYSEPLPRMQGREESLSEIVSHALKMLSTQGDEGFLLMVEGSQIDYAAHGNETGYLLSEMKDLEGAIRVAWEFAKDREDTLIIVTADHECGSLALRESKPEKRVHVEFMSRNHTQTMVPVFAAGPCSEMFGGMYDNTEIFNKIRAAAGY